ncbi:hypothetical protein R3P38DRAFT_3169503 [Favolaschia claudopus]|uniref:Uncharacterized protein n=1 Tax=Favolaschia claudopus TaxID=2862362 RepID=A0AAW0E0X6_9AGAR
MQQYPPQPQTMQMIPPPRPQPGIHHRRYSDAPAHPQRPTQSKGYPAPCIKYNGTAATSTSSVWGDSTRDEFSDDEYEDDDDKTIAAFSIASSQSRAPGNKPKQQRRVMSWVHNTSHYASEFRSPFNGQNPSQTQSIPPTAPPTAKSSGSGHRKHDRERRESSGSHHTQKREPPPIWIPRPDGPRKRTMSQPAIYQQPPHSAPVQVQYVPAPAVQQPGPGPIYVAAPPQPQMVWGPPPPSRSNVQVQYVAPAARPPPVKHRVSGSLTICEMAN